MQSKTKKAAAKLKAARPVDEAVRRRAEIVRAAVRTIKEEVLAAELPETETVSVLNLIRDEYSKRLDLYKHYMTVSASFAVLYYAVTGTVVSSALRGERWLGWGGVSFTVVMSFFFAVVFRRAYTLFEAAERHIKDLAGASGFECEDVNVLTHILKYSWIMYAINCVGLAALFIVMIFR
jgi:hypothetical protein